jgi:hypothetical protein
VCELPGTDYLGPATKLELLFPVALGGDHSTRRSHGELVHRSPDISAPRSGRAQSTRGAALERGRRHAPGHDRRPRPLSRFVSFARDAGLDEAQATALEYPAKGRDGGVAGGEAVHYVIGSERCESHREA